MSERIYFLLENRFHFLNAQEPLLPTESDAAKTKSTESKKKSESVTRVEKAAYDARVQGLIDQVGQVIMTFIK